MDNGSRAALIVLDGWAERDSGTDENRNAVADADTPNFDRLKSGGASGLLRTHGRSVGLSEGQMGNSEVGHLNIGAGRVVKQPLARIDDAIEDGRFFENDVLVEAVESGNHLHLMGLVSDGGVHSAQRHLHALLELADEHGREPVVHAFLDGRDTPPKSAVGYLQDLEKKTKKTGGTVGTVAGRYYAMDRDVNWDRTRLAYDAVTRGDGEEVKTASDPVEAVERAYERGETDEFVKPTIVGDAPGVSDGDSVVFFNFRADRARQLTRMINGMRPEDLEGTSEEAWEGAGLGVDFATMTEYDEVFDFPVAYPPEIPDNVLGEVVSDAGLSQFRIAETEKYAHVTYFLNGGREEEFEGEERVIVPSPDVATYDETPEMSADEVTDEAIDAVEGDGYDLVVLNYANPDMVGHTGDYEAAVEAVETVDRCLGRLVESLRDEGYEVVVTADHGNADEMGSDEEPHTAHTFNDAPFVHVDGEGDIRGSRDDGRGELRDVAPTLLSLLGVEKPDEMTGVRLVDTDD